MSVYIPASYPTLSHTHSCTPYTFPPYFTPFFMSRLKWPLRSLAGARSLATPVGREMFHFRLVKIQRLILRHFWEILFKKKTTYDTKWLVKTNKFWSVEVSKTWNIILDQCYWRVTFSPPSTTNCGHFILINPLYCPCHQPFIVSIYRLCYLCFILFSLLSTLYFIQCYLLHTLLSLLHILLHCFSIIIRRLLVSKLFSQSNTAVVDFTDSGRGEDVIREICWWSNWLEQSPCNLPGLDPTQTKTTTSHRSLHKAVLFTPSAMLSAPYPLNKDQLVPK